MKKQTSKTKPPLELSQLARANLHHIDYLHKKKSEPVRQRIKTAVEK